MFVAHACPYAFIYLIIAHDVEDKSVPNDTINGNITRLVSYPLANNPTIIAPPVIHINIPAEAKIQDQKVDVSPSELNNSPVFEFIFTPKLDNITLAPVGTPIISNAITITTNKVVNCDNFILILPHLILLMPISILLGKLANCFFQQCLVLY